MGHFTPLCRKITLNRVRQSLDKTTRILLVSIIANCYELLSEMGQAINRFSYTIALILLTIPFCVAWHGVRITVNGESLRESQTICEGGTESHGTHHWVSRVANETG